jgi:hypothetical protein
MSKRPHTSPSCKCKGCSEHDGYSYWIEIGPGLVMSREGYVHRRDDYEIKQGDGK